MNHFQILSVISHGEPAGDKLRRMADITLRIERDFDWQKDGEKLLKALRRAAELNED